MRQKRWLELVKDYDIVLDYTEGKAIRVADALSRKEEASLNGMISLPVELAEELEKLLIEVAQPGHT